MQSDTSRERLAAAALHSKWLQARVMRTVKGANGEQIPKMLLQEAVAQYRRMLLVVQEVAPKQARSHYHGGSDFFGILISTLEECALLYDENARILAGHNAFEPTDARRARELADEIIRSLGNEIGSAEVAVGLVGAWRGASFSYQAASGLLRSL